MYCIMVLSSMVGRREREIAFCHGLGGGREKISSMLRECLFVFISGLLCTLAHVHTVY